MSKKTKKEQIVETVLAQIPESLNQYQDAQLHEVVFRWFLTGRTGTNFRLTDEGMKNFSIAEIAYYDFDINLISFGANPKKFTIDLGKKIKCVFYLGTKDYRVNNKPAKKVYLRVYDHKVAMMISLYGNIDSYLESIKT